jgi:hypothetical protein
MRLPGGAAVLVVLSAARPAAAAQVSTTYDRSLERAARVASDIAVLHGAEAVAMAETGIAGLLPNPGRRASAAFVPGS